MPQRDPATAIAVCERALRQIMGYAYTAAFGPDWIARVAREDRVSDWENRAAREKASRGGRGVAGLDAALLAYAEFYDLINIADGHWQPLSPAFPSKKETLTLLWQAEKLRNTVAHSRELLAFESELLSGISGLIRNQVTIFMSSADPGGDFYPRIESVRDDFGQEADIDRLPGQGRVTSQQKVHPGDTITFQCRGIDPQGRQLRWELQRVVGMVGLDEAIGSDIELVWTVRREDVAMETALRIQVSAEDAEYHRMGVIGKDDEIIFFYRVDPPN